MKTLAISISIVVSCSVCYGQSNATLLKLLDIRGTVNANISASWTSKHFRNTTLKPKPTPFEPSPQLNETSALREFVSSKNSFYARGADVSIEYGLVVRSGGRYVLMNRKHSCLGGSFSTYVPGNGAGEIRPNHGYLECRTFEYLAFSLIYRPHQTEFYKALRKGSFRMSPDETVWAGQPAKSAILLGNGFSQTEYFFDMEHGGVFLGGRVSSEEEIHKMEIFMDYCESQPRISQMTQTVIDGESGDLKSKDLYENFSFDFQRVVPEEELAVEFPPGTHVIKLGDDGFDKFISRKGGKLEPLTKLNKVDLDPRANPK